MQKSTVELSPEEITEICQEIQRLLLRPSKTEFICGCVCELAAEALNKMQTARSSWLTSLLEYMEEVFAGRTLFSALKYHREYSPDTTQFPREQFRAEIVPVLIYCFRHGTKPDICLSTIERLLREFVATGNCSTEGMNEND